MMKSSWVPILSYALAAEAHAIFQKLSVNGAEGELLDGFRAPSSNYPVEDVTSDDIICGTPGSTSQTVIDVAAGDELGVWMQHVIGGPQFPNDPDNPIAASHKGPVMAYLAKVDDAASASETGLDWFKIWEDGFDTGSLQWGVDSLLSNDGWVYFNLPNCVAPSHYLLRVEAIALHSAYAQGGAQFYSSCTQINVSGSGSFSPSETVAFPGEYQASDESIMINIYGTSGGPDNDGKPYTPPGPSPMSC